MYYNLGRSRLNVSLYLDCVLIKLLRKRLGIILCSRFIDGIIKKVVDGPIKPSAYINYEDRMKPLFINT